MISSRSVSRPIQTAPKTPTESRITLRKAPVSACFSGRPPYYLIPEGPRSQFTRRVVRETGVRFRKAAKINFGHWGQRRDTGAGRCQNDGGLQSQQRANAFLIWRRHKQKMCPFSKEVSISRPKVEAETLEEGKCTWHPYPEALPVFSEDGSNCAGE